MSASILFLIIPGVGWKRPASWRVTSCMSSMCVIFLADLRIRTMQAWWSTEGRKREGVGARSSSHKQYEGRTRRTSARCFLSSSILSTVSDLSSPVSTLLTTMAILIFARGAVNPSLKANVSDGETSRDLGYLVRIRYFPHASDWSVRVRSAVEMAVEVAMSCREKRESQSRGGEEGSIVNAPRSSTPRPLPARRTASERSERTSRR